MREYVKMRALYQIAPQVSALRTQKVANYSSLCAFKNERNCIATVAAGFATTLQSNDTGNSYLRVRTVFFWQMRILGSLHVVPNTTLIRRVEMTQQCSCLWKSTGSCSRFCSSSQITNSYYLEVHYCTALSSMQAQFLWICLDNMLQKSGVWQIGGSGLPTSPRQLSYLKLYPPAGHIRNFSARHHPHYHQLLPTAKSILSLPTLYTQRHYKTLCYCRKSATHSGQSPGRSSWTRLSSNRILYLLFTNKVA